MLKTIPTAVCGYANLNCIFDFDVQIYNIEINITVLFIDHDQYSDVEMEFA